MSTISLDQFVAATPASVWRALTEPELVRRWWADGDISPEVGHEFTLDMPGFGAQPCRVLESEPPRRFVYTFTTAWTLTWTLRAEGRGTRVFLEHSGFGLDDKRMAAAFERMGPGWRDTVLPRLATVAAQA
ncbi:SRPBCC domain-containing protein [Tsukamurella sputi]|uniref:SRPBCC domain-containing protein n=1 Tax=Tsukamurella sputi TaxID=2591848 RepID=A0A5C5RT63_9ACTN|nr:SRPBCC domain-containing protein [Tsukamurella sputi]TWS26229.1 SRPBCC domain-containing protein [Tsukamurella sputi]